MVSFSGFNSAPLALTEKALAHNYTLEERTRREQAQLNKDFYYGKQEQSLTLLNDDVETYTINFTKPLVNKKVNLLYSEQRNREFDGPSSSISFLERVYEENGIDTIMKRSDLLAELTGSCLIHPMIDEEMETGIRLMLYDGTQFSAIGKEQDPMIPEAISLIRLVDELQEPPTKYQNLKDPQIKRVMQHQIWTMDSVTRYDDDTFVSTNTNDLGFIPFVNIMGEEVPDQFVGHSPANLIRKGNHQINQILTDLGFMIRMQSHTPIVLQGFKEGETIQIHPGRALNVPMDAAVETLDLNPKIEQTLETLQYLEDRLYSTSSVPRISIEGGEGESGRELLIRWHPLLSVYNEKSIRFERYELQLANMILRMSGNNPIEHVNIEWDPEDALPLSPTDQNLERDLRLNLKNPIDEIMRRNPDLTEREALQEYVENQELNQSIEQQEDNTQEEETNEEEEQDD